uniref:Glycosyl transferase CAP10 domain-containing protein n=1 Tax=viral metagenome TaxID=1070528 RepID=A0A6C0ELV0_9ZZZZ
MTVTFVTAFLNLHEDRPADKSDERRIELFKQLEATGIRLHVFCSPEHAGKFTVRNGVIEQISLSQLDTYAVAPPGLPDVRNVPHDTRNFLILMNSKAELVDRAIRVGNTTHYAWIDFNVCHVFRDLNTVNTLVDLSTHSFPDSCLYFPGCTGKGSYGFSAVNWRFCGGFFLGDKQSLIDFYDLYKRKFPRLPVLTWEVNVWAYFESCGWSPTWFSANHDDSIIRVPRSGIVYVPPDLRAPWDGQYSSCKRDKAICKFVDKCAKENNMSALFFLSDGIMGNQEYDRMITSLGRTTNDITPERKLPEIESHAVPGTRPVICTLCTRQVIRPVVLLPLDDDTFANGLPTFPDVAWEDRVPKLVWRGGSSGFDRPSIRAKAIDQLFSHPNADVRFVYGGWPENDAVLPKEHFDERIKIEDQVRYKYNLIIDGACIASSHQWVFGSGSVPVMVTHPDNDYWFRKYLIPMVHYVPIQYDLSDLTEKLEWLVNNDEDAKAIAGNAMYLAKRVFTPMFQQEYTRSVMCRVQQTDPQCR